MAKLRNSAPGTDRLDDAEDAFNTFCNEAVKRKKAVASDEADVHEFETWMLLLNKLQEQRNKSYHEP